jgi:molecular chaperone DnaJ
VREHPLFQRQDADVVCELPISFPQAALGGKLEVPTLDGKVELTIPAGTQTGRVFRMRGKGIPHLSGQGRGDQLVHVTVEVPRQLNKRQKELLGEFSESLGEGQHPTSRSFFDKVRELFGGEPAKARHEEGDEAR